jgi:hypothetical protein
MHALVLLFDGLKAFCTLGEMLPKVTAAHVVAQQRLAGFVLAKQPRPRHDATPPTSPLFDNG